MNKRQVAFLYLVASVILIPILMVANIADMSLLVIELPDYPWVQFVIEDEWDLSGSELITIYNDTVVYRTHDATYQTRVVVKDFADGSSRVLTAIELPCGPEQMDLWEEWLVMQVFCLDWPGWHYELWAYNLATDERVVITPPPLAPPEQTVPTRPVIDNNHIVWLQYDDNSTSADLYLYNLQSRTATSITHDRGPMAELFPDMDGDWIVWNGFNQENDSNYIVAYNLASSEQVTVTITPPNFYPMPKVDNDLVVWADYRDGLDNGDLYGLNLKTKKVFPLVATENQQFNHSIDNGLMVYRELDSEQHYSLHLYDLTNDLHYLIYSYPSYSSGSPDISNGFIVWLLWIDMAPDILYGARQLPERSFLPLVGQG